MRIFAHGRTEIFGAEAEAIYVEDVGL